MVFYRLLSNRGLPRFYYFGFIAFKDWIVFVILLLVSLGIGFFFGRNKNMTKDDFLMASKDMNPITGQFARVCNVTV